jgi:hypothetical protein
MSILEECGEYLLIVFLQVWATLSVHVATRAGEFTVFGI